MLLDRLGDMVATPRVSISVCLGDTPDPRLLPVLIDMLPTVGSYTDGENVLRWINALGPALSTDDLRRIVEAALDNDRIYRSSVGIKQMQIREPGRFDGRRRTGHMEALGRPKRKT
jgi:hypothetical protein